MLVKYSCGCIGFPPNKSGNAWIVKQCDRDAYSNEFGLFIRSIEDKSYENLSEYAENELSQKLSKLIDEGYGLRQIKSILS